MLRKVINNGSYDNDPSAETIRESFDKTNDNFEEIFTRPNVIIRSGGFSVYKAEGNVKDGVIEDFELEPGDVGSGWLADGINFIPFGKYLGGDQGLLASWAANPINWEE